MWCFYKVGARHLLFAQALNELNLPFDLHIFSKGVHGLGLGEDEPTVAIWPKLCENWLKDYVDILKACIPQREGSSYCISVCFKANTPQYLLPSLCVHNLNLS